MRAMPLTDGAVFAGYRILGLLGTGGMGEVYLVQHPRLSRREALKILPADISADPGYRQRFAREAELAASLWHPHIVEIHDRGEYDGQLWITMDYVEGTDASRLLRERYPHGMPPGDVLAVVTAIADALSYAHERDLLHRDVKPANILISDNGTDEYRILLADFGIARDMSAVSHLTATNTTVGTVGYAAPEQLRGTAIDGRADQYALACTAFHLFTGRPPFADPNPAAVISSHLCEPRPRLSGCRPDLGAFDDVLVKAMAKEPSHRFGGCREFAAALEYTGTAEISADEETRSAPEPPRPDPSAKQIPHDSDDAVTISRRTAWIGGSAAALLAVGVVAFGGARLAQPHPAPEPPTAQPQVPAYTAPYREPAATVSRTAAPPVTVTQPAPPAVTITQSDAAGKRGYQRGDLGLATPISFLHCDGQGIVVLGSVTTPGLYAAGVQRLLDAHPGAFYLRTDQSCPSLRQVTAEGNPIYAVFALGGKTREQVCAAVRAAGGNAYGKWLDTTTDPEHMIVC